jgi:hypothetical protein
MITETVNNISKSNQDFHKNHQFIEIQNICTAREESQLQKQVTISAYELLKIEQEAEICREQLETLKEELEYEHQLVEEYHQELLYANAEISTLNCELQDVYRLERLKLDKAKRLAQNILSSRQFTSKSLAELLSAIYEVEVTADEIEPIKIKYDKKLKKRAS